MQKRIIPLILIVLLLCILPIAFSDNNASAASQLTVRVCVLSENCSNGIDDDCDGLVDTQDADCYQPPAVNPPGGNWGGGAPQQIAEITSIQTGDPIAKKETGIFVLAKNLSAENREFYIQATVLGENLIEYEQAKIMEILGNSSELISFGGWVPEKKGEKILRARIYNKEKTIVIDEKIKKLEVKDEILFDLEIRKLVGVAKPGDELAFDILVVNNATFYNDFELSYWVEDTEKNKLAISQKIIAVKPNEEHVSSESLFIPIGAKVGNYFLRAQIKAGGVEVNAYKTFVVAEGNEYYEKATLWIGNTCEGVLEKINSLEEKGIDVNEEKQEYVYWCEINAESITRLSNQGKKDEADSIIKSFPETFDEINRNLAGKENKLKEDALNALNYNGFFFFVQMLLIVLAIFFMLLLIASERKKRGAKPVKKQIRWIKYRWKDK